MYAAGDILTADELNSWLPIHAAKSVNTPRTSTISRTADPHLTVPLLATYTYEFDLMLIMSSATNAAGDFSGELQWPANCTVTHGGLALIDTIASGNSASLVAGAYALADTVSPGSDFPMGCSQTGMMALLKGRIAVGATPGNLLLAWAQLASNINATTLHANSSITAQRVL